MSYLQKYSHTIYNVPSSLDNIFKISKKECKFKLYWDMFKLVSLHNKKWKMKKKAWKLFQIYGGVRFSILQIKLHVQLKNIWHINVTFKMTIYFDNNMSVTQLVWLVISRVYKSGKSYMLLCIDILQRKSIPWKKELC